MTADFQDVLALMEEERLPDAAARLDAILAATPLNAEAHMLRAVVTAQRGDRAAAVRDLWRALAIAPDLAGARAALGDLHVEDLDPVPEARDFALDSGERQVATRIEEIRADHRARYVFAARFLRDQAAPTHEKTGLDVFTGNGYGARLVAGRAGCRMIGLDGSADAVAQAEAAYGSHRVVFRQAYFPFGLPADSVDFAIAFESVEHVEDADGFLATIGAASRGPILLSFPLETGLPFAANRDLFRYHVRHFTLPEIADRLEARCGRRIVTAQGQKAYRLQQGRLAGLLPASEMTLAPVEPDSQFAVVAAA